MRWMMIMAVLGVLAHRAEADGDRDQVMVTDAGGDAVVIAGYVLDSRATMAVGGAVYLLGGPALHGYHDRWTAAGASFAVRLLAPVTLGALGCKVFGNNRTDPDDGPIEDHDRGCLLGAAAGVLVGGLGAQLLDWSVFSTTEDDHTPTARMFSLGGSF